MSNNGNTPYNSLFSSLISDIKSYNGNDPLLPWLRGIRKMKDTLPSQLLKEKLPRFLQKCSQTFLADRRYSNDLRYIRVWLQLMDFVDNPKAVLKTMEMNQIGMRKSLFYQAYALYYEKMKKFDAADEKYHLGVQNLAEPADELQKSYEQFLLRMERHKIKRLKYQGRKTNSTSISSGTVTQPAKNQQTEYSPETQVQFVDLENTTDPLQSSENEIPTTNTKKNPMALKCSDVELLNNQFLTRLKMDHDENGKFCSDDIEDARHHGLVEPTINTKEAMNVINSMFQEPLDRSDAGRRQERNQSKKGHGSKNEFKVLTDESLENELKVQKSDANKPLDEPFEIYVDGEKTNDIEEIDSKKNTKARNFGGVTGFNNQLKGSVFSNQNAFLSDSSKDPNHMKIHETGFREDTVVYRFVGSTIADEPKVENVLHHGLVEPTINFKEAMDDINGMFGEPIEYIRKRRPKKQDNSFCAKNNSENFLIYDDDNDKRDNKTDKDDIDCRVQKPLRKHEVPDMMANQTGFLILPDDDDDGDIDSQHDSSVPGSSTENGSGLFEQTLCTKEAMDEINKLFAMPMDF